MPVRQVSVKTEKYTAADLAVALSDDGCVLYADVRCHFTL